MSGDVMLFPDTVEEFIQQYKFKDTEHLYTNGAELISVLRMKQWCDHQAQIPKRGKWIERRMNIECSVCSAFIDDEVTCTDQYGWPWRFCPRCGAKMQLPKGDAE